MSGAESLIDGQSGKHHVHAMKLTKSGNAAYFRLRVILCYREASLRNVTDCSKFAQSTQAVGERNRKTRLKGG